MTMDKAEQYLDSHTDEWEIFFVKSHTRSSSIEKGKIKNVSQSKDENFAVRIIVGGRVGFASTTSSSKLVDACEHAIKLSRISGENLRDLPMGKSTNVEGIFDKRIKDVDSSWIQEAVESMINACEVNPAQGKVEISEKELGIINSSGTDLNGKGTGCGAFLEAVVEDSSGLEMGQSRQLDVDFAKVGKEASELASNSLNAEKMEKMTTDVVLSPVAFSQLLFFTLFPAFSAENIAKGRSMLAGRTGEDFGDFTLIDDGTLPYGLMTSSFDDEGVNSQKKVIFDEGTFTSIISDFRYSQVLGVEPTGNGFREGASYPATSPSNIILDFAEKSNNVKEEAFVVNSFIGAHTSNPVSGDFSLECQNSFFKEKPVKSAMLYGNIYELLKKIKALGKDVRQIDNTVTPSVRFGDMVVSG
ncbi:MAG: TldD/PmbA family protein [Archaeoglobaceae archaeon]